MDIPPLLRLNSRILLLLSACAAGLPAPAPGSERLVIRPRFVVTTDAGGFGLVAHPVSRPRVGLVLTGGGARGIAQVGVLRVLERHGIPIDFIAATSVGAIVGGLYASGWKVDEIDSLAKALPWEEVLSLTAGTSRRDVFVDQKVATDRSFLVVRFKGLQPVIPSAVSSGQRLTDLLSVLTLQSPYHAEPTFDYLKIPFRAIATDLVSGRRVILGEGSLAEALRASSTVPLVFRPVERDGTQLVDGGLISNVPVDVAIQNGCDIIIVVNSTSSLRSGDELETPWQTADQIIGIMMAHPNEEQLAMADIVITPDIGDHLAGDFTGLDSLITAGEKAAERKAAEILRLVEARRDELVGLEEPDAGRLFADVRVRRSGGGIPDSLWRHILDDARSGVVPLRDIRDHVELIYAAGDVEDVCAEVEVDSPSVTVTFVAVANPFVRAVDFAGWSVVREDVLREECAALTGRPLNQRRLRLAMESILRAYRVRGLALARIDSLSMDRATGVLHIGIDEGIIRSVSVEGGERTRDSFVLSEFPLATGDLFDLDLAQQGVTNINSTGLFEFVYLEPGYGNGSVVIRLKERPSQLVRLGLRNDNERGLQGSLDFRDEHFRGSGMELGLSIAGGGRNANVALEYKGRKLFDTYLTFSVSGFYQFMDSYLYVDGPAPGPDRWVRNTVGEYREARWGGAIGFGSQLERLGNATVEFSLQEVHIRNLAGAEGIEERYRLGIFKVGTLVDTKDSYPFPRSGVGFNLLYEFAPEALGGDIGYNALRLMWETFVSLSDHSTFHPRFTAGFADKTMPYGQQFRFGGRDSFFGLREDDRRGRQMLLANLEYRYRLPFTLFFDAYIRTRYDVGAISTIPEEIKFNTLRHGVGVELALDTPIGPAVFGAGKAFFLSRDLPDNPILWGPTLLYFLIGYQF